jgi:hypothetical protein
LSFLLNLFVPSVCSVFHASNGGLGITDVLFGRPGGLNQSMIDVLSRSILATSTASPRSFLPTLALFHFPASRRFGFLQLCHALCLPGSRLVGNIFASDFQDQGVQSTEASVRIVGLFSRVVGLDDQGI